MWKFCLLRQLLKKMILLCSFELGSSFHLLINGKQNKDIVQNGCYF